MQTVHKPEWLRCPAGSNSKTTQLKQILRQSKLNTVCEEARCPNIAECFGRGVATFMILGDVCTRNCRFCAVKTGIPHFGPEGFSQEVEDLVTMVKHLQLRHVVITSVTRDDLPDGGAAEYELAVRSLRDAMPQTTVELLVPDFQGAINNLQTVIDAEPDVLNHNLETVPRLYPKVRPKANYARSLDLLSSAKKHRPSQVTKTGIMLGLGEYREEVMQLMIDAKRHGVDIFTAGQYLQPSRRHLIVERYLSLEEFDWYRQYALEIGFHIVEIGPLVRSSYGADSIARKYKSKLQVIP